MVSNLGSSKRLFHNGGKGNFSFRLASMRTNVVDTNLTYVGQEFHVLSSQTRNKDRASSTTFTHHVATPVFLKLDFIGFAMLLLERTFWIFALVGSFTALSAYWALSRSSLPSLACAYPKDAHQQQPSSSCPSGKGLDKQLQKGRLSTWTTGVFSRKFFVQHWRPRRQGIDYRLIWILANVVAMLNNTSMYCEKV